MCMGRPAGKEPRANVSITLPYSVIMFVREKRLVLSYFVEEKLKEEFPELQVSPKR